MTKFDNRIQVTKQQAADFHRRRLRTPLRPSPEGPVLIIDDEPDDSNLARRIVGKILPEAAVVIAGSALQGVEYLETGARPFLILLDLKMPEMDGFGFLEWLHSTEAFADIPVVVISGLDELEHLRRAYALHARAFLVKPVTQDSVRSVLISLNFAV